MQRYAVIVAGGRGVRMGESIPKQFLNLAGRPLLMHTIEAFARYDEALRLIVALPTDEMETWQRLCKQHSFSIEHQVVAGGATRYDTVAHAIAKIEATAIVAIHDGARPCISQELIARCFEAAKNSPAVIPVTGLQDTLRESLGDTSRAVPRDRYYLVQTPQVFHANVLQRAYSQPVSNTIFTDDASLVEATTGVKIAMVEGSKTNIKITTPIDLVWANAMLACSTFTPKT